MKLIHLTDPHLVAPGGAILGRDPLANLESAIDDINAEHHDADLVVISGDLTNDGEEAAYRALARQLGRLVPPWRLTLGNHDDRKLFRAVFPQAPGVEGFVQARTDLTDATVITLDTLKPGAVGGELCATRLSWLDRQLAGLDKPAYLFLHHPPFAVHMAALDGCRLGEPEALWAVLQRHPGAVRHIFAGHVHRNIAGSWRGIPFTTLFGTNHQTALTFDNVFRNSLEPPSYAVVFATLDGVTVHFNAFREKATG